MPLLKSALDAIYSGDQREHRADGPPGLSKLDVTCDLRGSFFAQDDWKEKYQELSAALEH